jgi:Transposase DDE domain
MDLDSFLTELYFAVDGWWQTAHPPGARPRVGRRPRLSPSEVLTLAVLGQWPRWRSERDFWRFARAHLRDAFPCLGSQSQLNRRIRALEPELRALQTTLAAGLVDPADLYRVLDTTLLPAIHRVRACRHGLFVGQATFGYCRSKTDWVYGFKVALAVTPTGTVTAFGLAPAACDERPIGDALVAADRFGCYLTDKGFASAAWEAHWQDRYGATVLATPTRRMRRAWPAAACTWAAGKRQVVEQVIEQLKDFFALERHRAKTLGGLLARLAAKVAAFTCGQWLNVGHDRPPRHFADLLI